VLGRLATPLAGTLHAARAATQLAILVTVAIGMAKPSPPAAWYWKPAEAVVLTPITWPEVVRSGSPESPAWMSALTSMRPVSCSNAPVDSSWR
jgi:hypothetical protein